jgi:hypothetical protein
MILQSFETECKYIKTIWTRQHIEEKCSFEFIIELQFKRSLTYFVFCTLLILDLGLKKKRKYYFTVTKRKEKNLNDEAIIDNEFYRLISLI